MDVKTQIDELEKQGERSHMYQNDAAHERDRLEHAAMYQQSQEGHLRTQELVQITAINNFHLLVQLHAELQGIIAVDKTNETSCVPIS